MSTEDSPTIPGFVLLLVVLSTGLLVLILAPFAASLFAAAVLAGVMHPVQARLAEALGDRPAVAAGLLTVGVGLLAVAPLAGLCVFVVRELTTLYREAARVYDAEGIDGWITRVPEPLRDTARRAVDTFWPDPGARVDASGGGDPGAGIRITGGGVETATDVIAGMLDGLVSVLLDLGVVVISLFFLLSQGARLVDWILGVLPLAREEGKRLVGEFRDVTHAVFTATVVTAFLQTAVAAIGFWIASIDRMPIALLLTFVCALIPIVGAALVVAAVGGLLVLHGDLGYGIFLVAWGVLPVGLSDNLAKPWLAQAKLRLPGSVVLFAMLGGLAVFGPFGVVAGPLIVSFFLASLRLLRTEDSDTTRSASA